MPNNSICIYTAESCSNTFPVTLRLLSLLTSDTEQHLGSSYSLTCWLNTEHIRHMRGKKTELFVWYLSTRPPEHGDRNDQNGDEIEMNIFHSSALNQR